MSKDVKDTTRVENLSDSAGEVETYHEDKTFFEKVKKYLEIQPKGQLTGSQMFLYNYDLKPVEAGRRTWHWYNYVAYWISDSVNVNTFQIALSGIIMGLNWYQTWITVWLGYLLCGIFVSVGARIGIQYHISFPVASRTSFGIYGSLWPIFNRVVMSCVWYAVQCSVAGPCIGVMLRAIWKDLDKTMPNHISDPDLTTFTFLSFFLFWLFSLPFLWLHPHQLKYLFSFKSVVAPSAAISFLIWTLVKAHGAGPVLKAPATIHGSTFSWAFLASIMNSLANFATLIVNAPDFARFSTTNSFAMKYIVYTASIPICFSLTSLVGILITSGAEGIYGVAYWSPLDVLGRFLEDFTPANRAGVFIIGFCFAIAQLGTNISANSLSFGTDVLALLPRYLNIRRGGYICAMLALAINPWKLTSSSSKFTTYLSAYSVFLSAIAGVVACDYFYVRRGYIDVSQLYSTHQPQNKDADSIYRFNKFGINWRAYAAYLCGILPNIVGFVGATGTHVVPIGATRVYDLNFLVGFAASLIVYGALCRWFPYEGAPDVGPFEKTWLEHTPQVEDFEDDLFGDKYTVPNQKYPTDEYLASVSSAKAY